MPIVTLGCLPLQVPDIHSANLIALRTPAELDREAGREYRRQFLRSAS